MKVLITGATGFFGKHVTKALALLSAFLCWQKRF